MSQYPSHLIPNAEKTRDWILKYCKAAYQEFSSGSGQIFYNNRNKYAVIKDYAMGRQSINKYKKMLNVDQSANDSWLTIDWSVLPIVPRFRRQAISKLRKRAYNVTVTPIDPLSEQEASRYRAEQEVKIRVRQELAKQDPQLAQGPMFAQEPGDPETLEDLELQMNYTYKHKFSKEMEEVISAVLNANDYDEMRSSMLEDAFDYGVFGVKEYIAAGSVRVRKVYPENMVVSYARKRDFSDAQHIGEITMMSIADIKEMAGDAFSEEQYVDIAEKFSGRYHNPNVVPPNRGRGADYESFKIPVLDLEFYSVNQLDVESRVDKRGNNISRVFKKSRKRKSNKYSQTGYKAVYRAMWIVDTDYIFNDGLLTNMKRRKGAMTDTHFSYHLFAPEFDNMRAASIMEQVVPIADAIQLNWFKLQNAIAEARPKGIQIALDAIENIPLGGGGEELTPAQVLDLYNKKGTLVYRYLTPDGNPSQYKPIEELENGLARDVITFFNLIKENIQLIRDITGINEYVDGASVDPKTLSNVTRLAEEASSNALYNIVEGDRKVLERLANDIVLRIQDLKKQGRLEKRYVQMLGIETVRYIGQSDTFDPRVWGVKIEDRPNALQRERLLGMATQFMQGGFIEFEDLVLIETTDNLKTAQYILAHRVRKRKEEKRQESMMLQQQNAEVQQQAAANVEAMKHQAAQREHAFDMALEELKGSMKMQLEELKAELEVVKNQKEE